MKRHLNELGHSISFPCWLVVVSCFDFDSLGLCIWLLLKDVLRLVLMAQLKKLDFCEYGFCI